MIASGRGWMLPFAFCQHSICSLRSILPNVLFLKPRDPMLKSRESGGQLCRLVAIVAFSASDMGSMADLLRERSPFGYSVLTSWCLLFPWTSFFPGQPRKPG